MSAIRLVNVLLLLLLVGWSVLAWTHLPDLLPMHFDSTGRADGWAERSLINWFSVPVLAVVLSGGLWLLARYVPDHPRSINLPDRETFLRLSREDQRVVLGDFSRSIDVCALCVTITFGLAQAGRAAEAAGSGGRGYALGALLVAVTLLPLATLAGLARMQARITRLRREAREDARGAETAG